MLSTLLIDSSRSYKRLLKNKTTGGSRELFLPENDFQTSSTANFPKNIQILEARKPTEDMKFRVEFFLHNLVDNELNIIYKLFWACNRNIYIFKGL